MSTHQSPIVFAVFKKDSDAKKAIDALRDAGFNHDQIGLAWHKSAANVNYRQDLVNLGVSAEQAEYYDNEFKAGHPVVSVRADERAEEASSILRSYNAYGYTDRDSQTGDDVQATEAGYDTDTYATRYDNEERRSIPLREERLIADKQKVQIGEANLHKEVISEQQTIDVPVQREEVVVERHPGRGQVSETPIGQDETIRIPVHEEQVNVSKSTVETGEVSVGKRTVQDQRRVTDTVRREEAHLETDGNPIVHTNDNQENI